MVQATCFFALDTGPSVPDPPEQIADWLRADFPDDPEMWVSTEANYQSRYEQSLVVLSRELTMRLHTGRAVRRSSRKSGQGCD